MGPAMLVLSREVGQSVSIGSETRALVAVALLNEMHRTATLHIQQDTGERIRVATLRSGERVTVLETVVTLVDVTSLIARLGFEGPRDYPIFRSENRPDNDPGGAGKLVPNPVGPKPPQLAARLESQKSTDEDL